FAFLLLLRSAPAFSIFFFQAEDGIRDSSVTGVQTCALPISRRERVGDAVLAAVRHHPQKGVLGREVAQHVRSAVTAAVVDHDDLARIGQRQQRLPGLAHEFRKVIGLVLCRDQDAHVREGRAGGEAHSRLRMRAGRMLSWSRYFATVRRAILTPFCANISTICWSVSGFFGSSSATIFWIWARMARALASSPVVVEGP